MVARFLADEARRRWAGWFVVVTWTASLSILVLATDFHKLAKASLRPLRDYLAGLLAPSAIIVTMLVVVGGYVIWKARWHNGAWKLLALALLFQTPVCVLVTLEGWAPRQFLVAQTLVLCALGALVADAGEAALGGRGYPGRLIGALVAAPLAIFLMVAVVERAQALLPENPSMLSGQHRAVPQATQMVDWMDKNVPEGEHIVVPPEYTLNRYLVFLDGGRHEWTFLRLDQDVCESRPNLQTGCEPGENAISRIPPDAVWVHIVDQCKVASLSMSNLLEQMRQTRSGYVMISGNYKLPGILALPSPLRESGAFEIVHSELDHGGRWGANQDMVLLKRTGRAPGTVPTLMDAKTMLRLTHCERAKGPGYTERMRSDFPHGILRVPG
jgi:hypothetical protein